MIKPKSVFATLFVVAALALFTDCTKKGNDDPLISLRTRKNRITGGWKMTKGRTENSGSNFSAVYEYTEDGYTFRQTNGTQVTESSGTGSTFTIDLFKDGTMAYTRSLVPTQFQTVSYDGNWNFLGNIGNYKNKERVIFFLTKGSTTNNMVYDIVELRNKKIVLKKTDQAGVMTYSEEFTFEPSY